VRSLDSGALARFFARNSGLPAALREYFASFDLIVSYLYDPDKIFEENVRKSGADTFLAGPSKLDKSEHAAFQLARPLHALGLTLPDPGAHLFPSDEDRAAVRYLRAHVVLHPGSGSQTKNWPLENWINLGNDLLSHGHQILILTGEADRERSDQLRVAWKSDRVQFAENLPLPQIAALLEGIVFVGHDSGISHIAAAAGARCLLLFGWTDPAIWAPANRSVTVLRAPEGKMRLLDSETVIVALNNITR
jgi:heptosyltransferase-3